jgi:hypothetical protein
MVYHSQNYLVTNCPILHIHFCHHEVQWGDATPRREQQLKLLRAVICTEHACCDMHCHNIAWLPSSIQNANMVSRCLKE